MPRKPSSVCRLPGCPEMRPCPTEGHEPKPWEGSTRRAHVTSGWQQQRDNKRILRQHGYVCHVCDQFGAMTVDHVTPLAEDGTDTDDNKRPIHAGPGSCHERKTAAEAARGRNRTRA